jgi:hypothetical protein
MNLQFTALHTTPHHSLIVVAKKTGIQLAYLVIGLATFVLAGHAFDIEYLYRPVAGGPATHPFTAILFLSLSFSLILQFRKKSVSTILQFAVALTMLSLLLLNLASPIQPSDTFLSSPHLAEIFQLHPSNRLSV